MSGFQKSAEWKQYRDFHARLERQKSMKGLEALEKRIRGWEPRLDRALADRGQLAALLMRLLDGRYEERAEELQQPRDEPRVDLAQGLRTEIRWLGHETEALRELRKGMGRDPWVRKTLAPTMRVRADRVEARARGAKGWTPPDLALAAEAETAARAARLELAALEQP